MKQWLVESEFQVDRDLDRCIACGVCTRQCANEAHVLEADGSVRRPFQAARHGRGDLESRLNGGSVHGTVKDQLNGAVG